MPSVINTNNASLVAQRNLSNSQAMLTSSVQRLSSGLRINSAKDDAAGLGISAISAHALDVDPALDHLCVLDVEGFPVRSQWYLASPAQRRLSVVAQAFKDFLLAEAPRLRVQHAAVLQRHLQRHGT